MSTFGICLVLIALLYTETDSRKPNVVFVLTDDQDVMLGGQVNTKTNREFYKCICIITIYSHDSTVTCSLLLNLPNWIFFTIYITHYFFLLPMYYPLNTLTVKKIVGKKIQWGKFSGREQDSAESDHRYVCTGREGGWLVHLMGYNSKVLNMKKKLYLKLLFIWFPEFEICLCIWSDIF